MKQTIKYQGLTFAWALLIFTLCTIKLGSVGKSSMFFPGFDKLVHCGLFFVLTALLTNGIVRLHQGFKLSLTQYTFCFLVPILYGGIIELLQAYVFTWRSGEWDDLFADSVGVGMAIFAVILTAWSHRYEKQN